MKNQTCCFTGHRKIQQDKIEEIVINLNQEVEKLIAQGVTDFISGGDLGFDQIAASLIITKKEMGHKVRLIFALPCKTQDKFWSDEQKRLYHGILAEADEVNYISEEYTSGCIKKRNRYMIDRSAHCICALSHSMSSITQTVRYARQRGLRIINVTGV